MKYLVVIFGYLFTLVVLGFVLGKKKINSSDDYVVAGRRLPAIILVGTLLATWFGAGTVTGTAGFIYNNGPYAGLVFLGIMAVGVVVLYFIAGKVRSHSKYTVPQLLEMKYGHKAGFVAAICVILAYVGTVATQFTAAGVLISTVTGLDLNTAVLISSVVIILLAFSGGMVTVAYTDAISILIMIGGLILAIPFLISQTGHGFMGMFSALPEGRNTITGSYNTFQFLAYILPGFLLVMGDQNMLMRFGAAKDPLTAKKSAAGMTLGVLFITVLVVLVVTPSIYIFSTLEKPSSVIFTLAHEKVPFLIGAILLTGAASFIITTADSFLLSGATNITYDIWAKYFKKDATDTEKLKFMKKVILIMGIIGYVMTMYFPTILDAQMYTYTMYGAAITPAILLALLWKKATPLGGLLGIISGGAFTLIWDIGLGNPYGIKPALAAIPLAFIVIIVTSLLTQDTVINIEESDVK